MSEKIENTRWKNREGREGAKGNNHLLFPYLFQQRCSGMILITNIASLCILTQERKEGLIAKKAKRERL